MSPRTTLGLIVPALALALLLAPASLRAGDEPGKTFRFSVMGDNRPRTLVDPVTPPEEFLQAIREVNLLRPDLSLILGDLIMGNTSDLDLVGAEWDAFDAAVETFDVPVKLVAGNHDVWDDASRAIYEMRYGALHYAFVHEGCRFVVLNSEDLEHRDRIAGAQLEWLKGELAKGGRRIFLFLHKPFWRYEEGQSNWMSDVHPLLVEAGVDAVFAGHWHHYERSDDRDGIRYYITGGAGAEIGDCEYVGDFFHHLIVDVPAAAGEAIDVHVLKTGFLVEDTIVTETERERCYQFAKTLSPAGIEVAEEGEASAIVRLEVENPWDEPLVVRHELLEEQSGDWRMEPALATTLILPRAKSELGFRFRCGDGDKLPGPVLEVTATRGTTEVVKGEGRVPVRFLRTLEIPEVTEEIVIDGNLDEAAWRMAGTAEGFLSVTGDAWARHATTCRICRDDASFYVSFRCAQDGADDLQGTVTERDWRGLSEDCLVFYLDPVRDGKSRFCFGATATGVPCEYRAPGGVAEPTWNPDWPHAVARDPDGWTLEARIPFAILDVTPRAGMEIGFNVIRLATEGGREFSAWFLPMQGVLFDPKGFGTAVLR